MLNKASGSKASAVRVTEVMGAGRIVIGSVASPGTERNQLVTCGAKGHATRAETGARRRESAVTIGTAATVGAKVAATTVEMIGVTIAHVRA